MVAGGLEGGGGELDGVAAAPGAADGLASDGALRRGFVVGRLVARDDVAAEDGLALADGSPGSLATARSTAAPEICWLESPDMPWPISDTASKLPPVAAPAPSSQALTPIMMRPCTLPRIPD